MTVTCDTFELISKAVAIEKWIHVWILMVAHLYFMIITVEWWRDIWHKKQQKKKKWGKRNPKMKERNTKEKKLIIETAPYKKCGKNWDFCDLYILNIKPVSAYMQYILTKKACTIFPILLWNVNKCLLSAYVYFILLPDFRSS